MDRQTRAYTEERIVIITEVNLSELHVAGNDQFGTNLRISMQFFDPVTAIPAVGERWIVQRRGMEWFLGRRGEAGSETTPLTSMMAGDRRLEANTLYLNASTLSMSGAFKSSLMSQLGLMPSGLVDLGSIGTTVNINASLGNVFTVTTTANSITWAAPTNPIIGHIIHIVNFQSGYSTPNYTINAIWKVNNVTDAFSSMQTARWAVQSFVYNGTNWIQTSGLKPVG